LSCEIEQLELGEASSPHKSPSKELASTLRNLKKLDATLRGLYIQFIIFPIDDKVISFHRSQLCGDILQFWTKFFSMKPITNNHRDISNSLSCYILSWGKQKKIRAKSMCNTSSVDRKKKISSLKNIVKNECKKMLCVIVTLPIGL
jgi:hypothetical protein